MSREVRRVPIDFNWPLRKVWSGYLRPDYPSHKQCGCCEGSGLSGEAKWLQDKWYGNTSFDPAETGSAPFTVDDPVILSRAVQNANGPVPFACGMTVHDNETYWQHVRSHGVGRRLDCAIDRALLSPLVERTINREAKRLIDLFNAHWYHHLDVDDVQALLDGDRLWDFTRTLRPETPVDAPRWENGWLKESNGYTPTPAEVNRWSLDGMSHDSINSCLVIKAKCKRLGYRSKCAVCKGHGEVWSSAEEKRASEAWKETEPPTGDGYQLWETVSEGSPISPVFPTRELFIEWLITDGGRDGRLSRAAAEKFVEAEWAPSMVSFGDGLRQNAQAYEP